jgi:hypothetical protein
MKTRAFLGNWARILGLASALGVLLAHSAAAWGDPVKVHFPEGSTHGLLLLRSMDGKEIGSGDLTETVSGDRVSCVLKFQFHDGSLFEEDTQFSQMHVFRVLSYHEIERGPSFKQQMDLRLDAVRGTVNVHTTDEHGKQKHYSSKMSIPADAANGIVAFLAKNLPDGTTSTTVSMIVAAPKPRLVNLIITPQGVGSFPLDGQSLQATRYDVKVDIPGITGAAAKVTGRQPPDSFIWMTQGKVPVMVMGQQELQNGPICRIELAVPKMPPVDEKGF